MTGIKAALKEMRGFKMRKIEHLVQAHSDSQ